MFFFTKCVATEGSNLSPSVKVDKPLWKYFFYPVLMIYKFTLSLMNILHSLLFGHTHHTHLGSIVREYGNEINLKKKKYIPENCVIPDHINLNVWSFLKLKPQVKQRVTFSAHFPCFLEFKSDRVECWYFKKKSSIKADNVKR